MSKPQKKSFVALLIPAHNEELVIENTIRSAIAAGLKAEHIYVVDDNSDDATAKIARSILPKANVMRVKRSGKGLAIKKAGKKFALSSRYRWIHIADADGYFDRRYFTILRRELRVKYAAATCYIRSLKGKYVSQYRVFEYTIGMEIHRRVQSTLNVIPIIPGPTSCFRADTFDTIDFGTDTLTEDFDVTMQIHRGGLGRIQFIPQAVAYTQDPFSIKDYIRQITRWNRGILQVMLRHKVMRKISFIDMYLKYQVVQNLLFFVNFFVWIPYLVAYKFGPAALAVAFLYDVFIMAVLTIFSAVRVRRYDIIGAFPHIYALRWISMLVFLKAFIEVMILGKYRQSKGVWGNRRYKLSISDAAN
jgi:biofilm PGA synthesis N-glycosyltransferase PgaC